MKTLGRKQVDPAGARIYRFIPDKDDYLVQIFIFDFVFDTGIGGKDCVVNETVRAKDLQESCDYGSIKLSTAAR